MVILCHRGFWGRSVPANSLQALKASLESGFGFESDLRDYQGRLVIAHNIAEEISPAAEQVFAYLQEYSDRYCFAVNIKADGLKDQLAGLLKKYHIKNYFAFDMSVPQMIEYRDMGITYFTRQSEHECAPVLYADAAGVWIDAFEDDAWVTERLIEEHVKNGKKVCLVSPDLHGRDPAEFWARLKKAGSSEQVMLCTDRPIEADQYFNP